ncbi:hypothetical protein E2C01_101729 [Portunus trituberculatus]|uniref:Uncharacterized protein n=1 Tax=Portunus trituberculatus TaxID=210409 RepID=A0A5B7KGL1_PORTR|nr:hypothetical protein [Portunus trituberculatus]
MNESPRVRRRRRQGDGRRPAASFRLDRRPRVELHQPVDFRSRASNRRAERKLFFLYCNASSDFKGSSNGVRIIVIVTRFSDEEGENTLHLAGRAPARPMVYR